MEGANIALVSRVGNSVCRHSEFSGLIQSPSVNLIVSGYFLDSRSPKSLELNLMINGDIRESILMTNFSKH